MTTFPISGCPLLQDPPFVLLLVLVGTALGHLLLRHLHAPCAGVTALERGVLATALGLGVLSLVPFTLGVCGLLTPGALRATLFGSALLLAPTMFRVARGFLRRIRPGWLALPAWVKAGMVVLAVPLALVFLQALCPPTDSDGLGYHLAAPKYWLQWGNLGYLPTYPHTNSPMGVAMLFTYALALCSDTAAKLIHFALGMLTLAAIFALGRRVHRAETGFFGAFGFLIGLPVSALYALPEFAAAYVDLGIAFETVSAVLAWFLWQRTGARAWLVCAALCAGFAASFKLTGLFLGCALAVLTLREIGLVQEPEGRDWRRGLLSATLVLVLALLPVLPWLARSWVLTGNPIWPVLSGVFPTRDWSSIAAQQFTINFRYGNWGNKAFTEASLEKRRLVHTLVLALVPAVLLPLGWRWKHRDARVLLLLLGLIGFLTLWQTGLTVRFFLPLLPFAYLLCGLALGNILVRSRMAGITVVILCVLGSLLHLRKHGLTYVGDANPPFPEAWNAATGRESREAYLTRHLPIFPLWQHVSRELASGNMAPGDTILITGLVKPYYCPLFCLNTDFYGPQYFDWADPSRYLASLQRRGIRYVVLPRTGDLVELEAMKAQQRLLYRLLPRYGTPLFDGSNERLYRLDIPVSLGVR